MYLNTTKVSSWIITLVFFLSFLGFYAALALMVNLGAQDASRDLTIPLRIVILGGIIGLFALKKKLQNSSYIALFYWFAILYISRVIYEILNGESYYITQWEVLSYFLSFAFFPFLLVGKIKFDSNNYDRMLQAILLSGLLFGLLTFLFYKEFIGVIGRLSSSTVEYDVLSPLTLSYCGTLAIGVSVTYWLENKISFSQKLYIITIVILSSISFFLGASRGSLIALFLPFFLIFSVKKNLGSYLRLLLIIVVALVFVVYFAEQLGSNIINRFTNISSAVEAEDSSAIRAQIWSQAMRQFADYPIFGEGLAVKGFEGYPHNLFVEVLLSTGLLGFIPLLLLVISAFKKTMAIFRNSPEYAWLGVIFIQSFSQSMFSGAIYTSSWLWLSMALVFSFNLKKNYQNDYQ